MNTHQDGDKTMRKQPLEFQLATTYNTALVETALLQLLADVAIDNFEGIVELFEKIEPRLLEGFIDEELLEVIK
jgi:hypothetical protein